MKKVLKNYLIVMCIFTPFFYYFSRLNYPFFHTGLEFIISTIGINIFVVSQIPRVVTKKNTMLILIGPGLLASSLINLIHILTYEGIVLVGKFGTNTSTQFWIILNFTLAVSFLLGAFNLNKKFNYVAMLTATMVISCILTVLPFLNLFPICFIPGQGVTLFKMISEYIFVLMYIVALIRYIQLVQISKFRGFIVMGLLIISHLSFSTYFSILDVTNFIGHYTRMIAFGAMYIILLYEQIYEPYRSILYSSLHDELTNTYNRKYFENLMKDNKDDSAGIIVFDIDGLRLINESLGHDFGDEIIISFSDILQNNIDGDCISARIGGDEFAVLIKKPDNTRISAITNRIQQSIATYNKSGTLMPLSVSVGYSTKELPTNSLVDIFKQADDNLRREKLLNFNSGRSAVVKALIKTLETRDIITEGHSNRIRNIISKLAISCGINENKISDIILFSEFHDIGKVGVPDSILMKNGSLTKDEFIQIQLHSEYGYNIAKSTTELNHIADWILKHHEKWDGTGYPLGIKGEEIPIECRILAILDAYDAMTNDRPYRAALSEDFAIAELKRCAGTQFDPKITEMFIEILAS